MDYLKMFFNIVQTRYLVNITNKYNKTLHMSPFFYAQTLDAKKKK